MIIMISRVRCDSLPHPDFAPSNNNPRRAYLPCGDYLKVLNNPLYLFL